MTFIDFDQARFLTFRLRSDPIYIDHRGGGRPIIGGGGGIHVFVFTDCKNNLISKNINDAEHEYMNINPPPPIINLPSPLIDRLDPSLS